MALSLHGIESQTLLFIYIHVANRRFNYSFLNNDLRTWKQIWSYRYEIEYAELARNGT
jgi:hypothetical protein